MLKKIFAKLRETISPSRAAKPAAPASHKPVSASQAKPHASSSRGEARHAQAFGSTQTVPVDIACLDVHSQLDG